MHLSTQQQANLIENMKRIRQLAYNQGLIDGHSDAMEGVCSLLTNLAASTLDNEEYDENMRTVLSRVLAGMAIELDQARKEIAERWDV